MYKNNNMHIIEIDKGSIDTLVQNFLNGAQIVFIIEEGQKLLGATTEGDIKRFFRSKKIGLPFDYYFSKNIMKIIYVSNKQVYEDAKRIFNINKKICNIPVVDKFGKLLFQIDRYSENVSIAQNVEKLLEAGKTGALDIFLKTGNVKEIILIGADENSLYKAKEIFFKYCYELVSEKNIIIKTANNISECCIINDNTKVILTSDEIC